MKIALSALVVVLIALSAAEAAVWTNTASGNWNVAGNWNPNDVPDTDTEAAVLTNAGTYTITLNNGMYPSGLAIQSLFSSNNSVNGATIDVDGATGNRLKLDVTNRVVIYGATLDLNEVDLTIYSTTGGDGLQIDRANNGTLNVTNSAITILNAASGAGVFTRYKFSMADSALTVLGHPSSEIETSTIGNMAFRRTTLIVSNVNISAADSDFNVNNTGLSTTSIVALAFKNDSSHASGVTLTGGIWRIGQIVMGVADNSLTILSGVDMRLTGSSNTGQFGDLQMDSGSAAGKTRVILVTNASTVVATYDAVIGASTTNRGSSEVRLTGNSTLRGFRDFRLGYWRFNTNARSIGSGLLRIFGGSFQTEDLILGGYYGTATDDNVPVTWDGSSFAGDGDGGDGYYEQTGGTATVGRIVFRKGSNTGGNRGAREFRVVAPAQMILKGSGMVIGYTNGNWLVATNDWNTSGTLRYEPTGSITQGLVAVAQDLGSLNKPAYNDSTAIGTLDLRGLVASNAVLNVVAASNFTANAVYVRKLLMGSPVNPGSFFRASASSVSAPMYVYYLPDESDIVGTHAFADGKGWLVQKPSPRGTVVTFR